MTNVSIGVGSVANVIAALVSIGFEQDQTNTDRVYWTKDTNHKMYLRVYTNSSNTAVACYNSSGTVCGTNIAASASGNWKMTYELVGDSVLVGFTLATTTYNKIQFGIVAPTTNQDSWIYLPYYSGFAMYSEDTETALVFGTSSLYQGSANGIQLVKAYDGVRFTDNLYIATVLESLRTAGMTNDNNYYEATIGNDKYIVFKTSSQASGTSYYTAPAFAIKKSA